MGSFSKQLPNATLFSPADPWSGRGGVCVVVGSQWGDEGKGKLVDILSSTAHWCIRAQGGDNAGHTIVHADQKYDVHIIPSGLVSPNCKNLIGSGCVIHIPSFFSELDALEKKGISTTGRILVSDRAHVVCDLHRIADGLEEAELKKISKKSELGTTHRGIGPTYSSKATRSGLRVIDMLDEGVCEARLRRLAENFGKRYGGLPGYDVDQELVQFKAFRDRMRPFVVNQVPILEAAKQDKQRILVEGANAILLDIDHGTYPFVTSSNTGVGGALTGLTIGWRSIREVIGVVKAYTTRVGSGPFPTELLDEDGQKLQSIGKEFGVTTGRKRRTGWLDLVLLRHSHCVNDYTAINLTKLDVLDSFDKIKIATRYEHNGVSLDYFPSSNEILETITIVYESMPGWNCSTVGLRDYQQLPENAKRYLERIEKNLGVPIRYIGTGPDREDMIVR